MGRNCHTCEVLKELYWLKLNHFLLAMRSASSGRGRGEALREEELVRMKDETLAALTTLVRHAKACCGLAQDEAA